MIALSFYSCTDIKSIDDRLKIYNSSSKTIVYEISTKFPDTSLSSNFYNVAGDTAPTSAIQTFTHVILPSNTNTYRLYGQWEGEFSSEIPSGKIEIFIFDLGALKINSWDTIAKNYLILKRYDLTLDSLKKMNWLIRYP